jgi:hypothetical protein
MVRIKYIIIAVLVVIFGVWGIWAAVHFFQSEEKKVKKQFHLLSKWVSKETGENTFTMAQKIKNIGTLFGKHCELKADLISFSGRYTPEEISSYAARARFPFSSLSLQFYDFSVAFPEEGIAKVTLTGKLTGRTTTGEDVDETHELECVLKKIEKKWLFSDVEVVEVLKK